MGKVGGYVKREFVKKRENYTMRLFPYHYIDRMTYEDCESVIAAVEKLVRYCQK